MSIDIVERITKLIALASSPMPEEARTAAFLACKLIRENGLIVTDSEIRQHHVAPVAPPTVYVYRDRPAASPSRRVIASKYSGRCQVCGARYSVGASIAWARDAGAVCLGCHRQARAA